MPSTLACFCGFGMRRGRNRSGPHHVGYSLHKLHQSLYKSNFTGMDRAVLVMALVVGIR